MYLLLITKDSRAPNIQDGSVPTTLNNVVPTIQDSRIITITIQDVPKPAWCHTGRECSRGDDKAEHGGGHQPELPSQVRQW